MLKNSSSYPIRQCLKTVQAEEEEEGVELGESQPGSLSKKRMTEL